jgi:hypothetical protein
MLGSLGWHLPGGRSRRQKGGRVGHLDQAVGHCIISDKPMSKAQWIAERTKAIEAKAESGASPPLPDTEDQTAKPLE